MVRLRLVLALSVPVAAIATIAACDGDDTPPYTFPDASKADVSAPDATADTGAPDSGGPRAKVIVAHASPDLPPVRVCFALGAKSDGSDAVLAPVPPLPDAIVGAQPYPGLFPGTGSALPDFADLTSVVVVPYVIVAEKVKTVVRDGGGALATCDALLSADAGLVAGGDYFKLPPLPAGTFGAGKTLLVAATGCLPAVFDPAADAASCGGDYSALLGNVSLTTFELDRKAVDAAKLGAQVAHLSPAVQGKLQQNAPTGVTVGFANVPDAGTFYVPIAQGVRYKQLAPQLALATPIANADLTALSVSVLDPDGGAPLATYVSSLASVAVASGGDLDASAAATFKNGANYTFVVVGDPSAPATFDGGANGRTLHVIAFPSDPTVPKYP
jgi:hypothetical protein